MREEDPELTTLIRRIDSNPKLQFKGLLSHAGNCYGAKGVDDVRRIAAEECRILGCVRERIEAMGIEVAEVSLAPRRQQWLATSMKRSPR